MFRNWFKTEQDDFGQGLAEYSLVIVLASIVVVGIVSVVGQSIVDTYCQSMVELYPDADLSSTCHNPVARLVLLDQGPNYLNVEAEVTDPDAPPDDPYREIANVKFFIDDPNGRPVKTETSHRYCLGGGDGSCGNYDISRLAPGEHTLFVSVRDKDDNVFTRSMKFHK